MIDLPPTSQGAGGPAGVAADDLSLPASPTELLVVVSRELALHGLERVEEASRAFPPADLRRLFELRTDIRELAVLRSCQRFEVLALLRDELAASTFVEGLVGGSRGWTVRSGPQAVDHVFRVAFGLESFARGERDVVAQMRETAHRTFSRSPRPILRRLLGSAASAAGARPAPEDGEAPSVAGHAVRRILDWPGDDPPQVLVLGAGGVARTVARGLRDRAQVTLLYHERPLGEGDQLLLGCRAAPWCELEQELARADVVVAAAKDPGRSRPSSRVRATLPPRPRWFFDLGMPRNLDPALREVPGVELWDLGRLARETPQAPAHPGVAEAAAVAASGALARLVREAEELRWASLWRAAERVRHEEVERALGFAPGLSGSERLVLERLSERLVRRILSPAVDQLRGSHAGAAGPIPLDAGVRPVVPEDPA